MKDGIDLNLQSNNGQSASCDATRPVEEPRPAALLWREPLGSIGRRADESPDVIRTRRYPLAFYDMFGPLIGTPLDLSPEKKCENKPIRSERW